MNSRKALLVHAKASGYRDRILSAIRLAESDPAVVTRLSDFDADPLLFGVENGFIDLRDGSFHLPERLRLITQSGEVTFSADADCPRWLAFLEVILPDTELRLFVQRAVGYALTGLTIEQCFFFLWGAGANGKSTLLSVIQALLGTYAAALPSDALMAGNNHHPEILARLAGIRLVVSNELNEGQRFSESQIKHMTGGDAIIARAMYGSSFEFHPQFKLFVAGNHKPDIRGMDHGIWRRVKLIPFTVQIPKHHIDQHLTEKLRSELPGILNWAIEGCLSWQKVGLADPEAMQIATQTYRDDTNVVGKWLSERCTPSATETCLLKHLYTDFRAWAEIDGEYIMPRKQFTPRLEANGFSKIEPPTNKGYRIKGINLKQVG